MKEETVTITVKGKPKDNFKFKAKVPKWVGERIISQVIEEVLKREERKDWHIFKEPEKEDK